ncbi:MAG: hypothetical protein QXR53_02800 [Candidatus Norongarragalinales archaeon]
MIKKYPFEQAQFGHDKAHSRGGRTTVKNALTLHPHCNTLMRTKSLARIRSELGKTVKKERKKKRKSRSPSLYSYQDFGIPRIKIPKLY